MPSVASDAYVSAADSTSVSGGEEPTLSRSRINTAQMTHPRPSSSFRRGFVARLAGATGAARWAQAIDDSTHSDLYAVAVAGNTAKRIANWVWSTRASTSWSIP